mmetsp:Transcript_26942/g.59865  ORF Transcript_26942/g.59865 Transcript_26942/m.59865 type:complete len:494 (+) Transcript_26942:61-1542(+)
MDHGGRGGRWYDRERVRATEERAPMPVDDAVGRRRLIQEVTAPNIDSSAQSSDGRAGDAVGVATSSKNGENWADTSDGKGHRNAAEDIIVGGGDKRSMAAMLLNEDTVPVHVASSRPNNHHKLDLQSSPTSVLESYPTTLLLILTLHVVFFRQWNTRTKRSDVAATYRQVARQKRFHRLIGAFLSSPAPDYSHTTTMNTGMPSSDRPDVSATGRSTDTFSTSISMGSDDYENERRAPHQMQLLPRFVHCIRAVVWPAVQSYLQPFTTGHLTGLPCLFFTSHMMWQCRALEELYSYGASPFGYLRVLVGLTVTSVLLEIAVIRRVLVLTEDSTATISTDATGRSSSSTFHHRLLDREVCTVVSTASSIMVVFSGHFPNVPLDVFPFFRGGGEWMCTAVLLIVSSRVHAVTGVFCGMLSGTLWMAGVTSWLSSSYWGGCMLATIGFSCILSLKAGDSTLSVPGTRASPGRPRAELLLPFIDYVSWDGDAVVHACV